MKLSITLFLTSIVSSSAFVAVGKSGCSAPLQMSEPNSPDGEWGEPEPAKKVAIKSQALPFTNAPLTLDGSMAGDVGFDLTSILSHSNQKLPEKQFKQKNKMKLSITLFLTSIVSSSAFVSVGKTGCSVPLQMSDPNRYDEWGFPKKESDYGEPAPVKKVARKSQALPFAKVVFPLDGSMAGDVGFDPLGFAKTEVDLSTYREAEIKHARLAMLAAAG
eukprot:CAMPEP_0194158874 /NCGR_PEP_ID=MMETSP0152-20130528/77518_1 /TAXON_ID=1049557 /ORGANISM="Thalassiothrix antarctica, Strain L6-D1" /LENGTH=217 /DNA_ID=CAMNT_0038868379 /DNA_START=140 /DNA_END=790 /DNA_ORIENTATION=-